MRTLWLRNQTRFQMILPEPETRNMTNADCLALLMGDDPPQEIENSLYYRFLTSLFRRWLGILAAQGEGL